MRYNLAQLLQRTASQWRKGDCRGIGASGSAMQSELGAGQTVALRMDLMMLAFAWLGGRERTLQEFQELAKTAGFASVSVVASIDFLSVLEFNKA